jgi:hypothetical protein
MYLNKADAASGASRINAVSTDHITFVASTSGCNPSSQDVIMYAWAKTSGAIAVGQYTGNNDPDGPYVIVDDGGSGFRPAFVMLKATAGSQNWRIHDSARNGYNGSVEGLFPNTSGGEDTEDVMDMVSNGFKIRSNNANCNGDGVTFIYLAFAEEAFASNSRAR